MAAPTTAYKSKMLRAAKGQADTTPDLTTARDIYIAKILQNTTTDSGDGYFNEEDTDADKVQKIKDLFKLDVLDFIKIGTSFGFVGRVEITIAAAPSSPFSRFHKNTRFAGIPEASKVNGVTKCYDFLNDSGLNTKGSIPVYNKSSSYSSDLAHNAILFPALTFKSAFYVATTAHGLAWRKSGDTAWNYASKGGINAKGVQAYTDFSIDVDPTDVLYLEAPNTYDVAPYIENAEGLIRLDGSSGTGETEYNLTVLVSAYPKTLNYDADSIAGAYMGTDDRTMYMTRRKMVVGAKFILDATGGSMDIPDDGIYLDMTANEYGQRTYYVLEDGIIIAKEQWSSVTGLEYNLPYMAQSDTLANAWNIADALNFTTDYVGRVRFTTQNGGEWYMYSDGAETEHGVFLLEAIRADEELPYNYTNDTKYWIQTDSSFKVIAYNLPNNDLPYYVQSKGTVIQ